jgi:hypothetical protein
MGLLHNGSKLSVRGLGPGQTYRQRGTTGLNRLGWRENRLSFTAGASIPDCYHQGTALVPCVTNDDRISCTFRGESFLDGDPTNLEQAAATIIGESTITADWTEGVCIDATFLGEGFMEGNPTNLEQASATLDPGARPSAFDIAQEIWQSQASGYMSPGTMGEKLNAAGTAGDPWTKIIEAGYSAEDILKFIASALVGKTSKSGSTVIFRDLDDVKDRITGTVDSEGNRTDVELDGS